MSIGCKKALNNMILRSSNKFGRREAPEILWFATDDYPSPDTVLKLFSGLKSPIRGYHQDRPLEIFSHINYNTASPKLLSKHCADVGTRRFTTQLCCRQHMAIERSVA
jgi:hypothetical protein